MSNQDNISSLTKVDTLDAIEDETKIEIKLRKEGLALIANDTQTNL